MDVAELTALHQSLGDVIAASQQALDRSAHERSD
jgi:hypothetical protein